MARFALALTICATVLSLGNIGVHAQDIEKGLDMGTKSVQGACWYEYLKIKPDKNTKSKDYNNCFKNLSLQRKMAQFEKGNIRRGDYQAIKPSMGNSLKKSLPTYLPTQYTSCNEYLDDPEKEYGQDYSTTLRDGSGSYPYKGWAHCLMAQLEKAHGQDAISAMEEKWSAPSHPWMNEVYNRENENRARHGSPAMKLNDELSKRAQKWADHLAAKCEGLTLADHLPPTHPDGVYEDKRMGENIAEKPLRMEAPVPDEDQALGAANEWYEEIRSYPWPEFKGKANDPLFVEIGHFTASIWKGVEQVGYGLGKRDGCDKVYVVGRYWPSGNVIDHFGENISPPKK